jgi:hypothetical protein
MFEAVFSDPQPQGRELAHLPPLHPTRRIAGQLALAGAALAWPMRLHHVRCRHE